MNACLQFVKISTMPFLCIRKILSTDKDEVALGVNTYTELFKNFINKATGIFYCVALSMQRSDENSEINTNDKYYSIIIIY